MSLKAPLDLSRFNSSEEIRQAKWDIRFLGLAEYWSSFSKDPSTKAGAVIVRPNGSVAGLGFNGFPQGMPDLPELYSNREEKYSRTVHCEINAKTFCTDPSLKDYTLYTWPFATCDRCCVQMLQSGIHRFVFPAPSADALTRWATSFERTKNYIRECGAVFTEIPIVKE